MLSIFIDLILLTGLGMVCCAAFLTSLVAGLLTTGAVLILLSLTLGSMVAKRRNAQEVKHD